jgi:hypothetical protein
MSGAVRQQGRTTPESVRHRAACLTWPEPPPSPSDSTTNCSPHSTPRPPGAASPAATRSGSSSAAPSRHPRSPPASPGGPERRHPVRIPPRRAPPPHTAPPRSTPTCTPDSKGSTDRDHRAPRHPPRDPDARRRRPPRHRQARPPRPLVRRRSRRRPRLPGDPPRRDPRRAALRPLLGLRTAAGPPRRVRDRPDVRDHPHHRGAAEPPAVRAVLRSRLPVPHHPGHDPPTRHRWAPRGDREPRRDHARPQPRRRLRVVLADLAHQGRWTRRAADRRGRPDLGAVVRAGRLDPAARHEVETAAPGLLPMHWWVSVGAGPVSVLVRERVPA